MRLARTIPHQKQLRMLLPRLQKKTIYLLLILSFFLSTCAPLPQEGESLDKAEVTLTLQHRSSERIERAGSSSRSTEFIVVVNGGEPFSEQGSSNYLDFRLLDLSSN